MKPINIIVFSKDRAMQLDLFLRSFENVTDCWEYNIIVLYTCSDNSFASGYKKLMAKGYSNVFFLKETNFKANLIHCMENHPHTVFFMDDNIFIRPFDFYDEQMDVFNGDHKIACRSLRLNPNLIYCYPAQTKMRSPVFYENNVFEWAGAMGDYGYPMSLDGHIFRTKDIEPYIKDLDYSNPNTLEGRMAMFPLRQPKMMCYDKSIIINNPINKVQTVNNNIHGNITASFLNEKWLDGYSISLEPFIGINNFSCHQEMDITYDRHSN